MFDFNQYLVDFEPKAKQNGLEFVEELIFEDGSQYRGYTYSEMPHGPGRLIWTDNSKYEGEWKQGIRHGRGK